jgi:hypothetical protein
VWVCVGLGSAGATSRSQWGLIRSFGQQDDRNFAALDEIDPVSGPVIDSQLRDALANGLGIPCVPERQAPDVDVNATPGDLVSQTSEPFGASLSLLDLDHAIERIPWETLPPSPTLG